MSRSTLIVEPKLATSNMKVCLRAVNSASIEGSGIENSARRFALGSSSVGFSPPSGQESKETVWIEQFMSNANCIVSGISRFVIDED